MYQIKHLDQLSLLIKIENYSNLVDYKIKKAEDEKTRYKLIGEKDALFEKVSSGRRDLIKSIRECREEIEALKEDIELFELDIKYLEGYIKGINVLLDTRRRVIEENGSIRIVGYVPNEIVGEIITILFGSVGFEKDEDLNGDHTIYLTSDIKKINKFILDGNTIGLIFCFRYIKPKKFKLSKENKEQLEKLRSTVLSYETDFEIEIDLIDVFTMLSKSWQNAKIVYLDSILTVETVISSIINYYKL